MRRILARLRDAVGGGDQGRAFAAEQRVLSRAAAPVSVDPRFRQAMEQASSGPNALIGQAVRDPALDVRLTLADILSHSLVLGATGSGKTRLVCAVVLFLLRLAARAPHRLGLVLLDYKSEFASLVSELATDLLNALPPAEADNLVSRWVVFNPFSQTSLLPLQILAPDPKVPPEIQAAELTSVVERMGGALGVKQDSFTYNLLLFGIIEELNLLDLRRLLTDLPTLEARARACSSVDVRDALGGATKLQRSSLDGVVARLDRLLRPPSMRLMLGARTCVSFRDIIGTKFLIADVGSPPLGLSDLTSFWAGFLMMRLTRSIFERTQVEAKRPVVVFADEWQVGLAAGAEVADEFERLLALARSRAVHLWMISQSMTGVAKVSASLPDVVATNAMTQILGRAAIKDARLMSHLLPVTGREARPAAGPWETAPRSPFLTVNEERERLVEGVANMPSRTFYLWRRSGRAELIRSATVEPRGDGFTDAARMKRGALAVPIAQLEAEAEERKTATFEPVVAAGLTGPRRRPGPA